MIERGEPLFVPNTLVLEHVAVEDRATVETAVGDLKRGLNSADALLHSGCTSMAYRPQGHRPKRSLSGLSLNAASRSAS